jgi:nucleotide-binding universal stress UspA family protein
MFPFRNILYPTNFSAHSRAALKYASAFARTDEGKLFLVSVQGTKVPRDLLTLPDEAFTAYDNQWLAQIRSDVREVLEDPLLRGLEIEPVIVDGEPARVITRAAIDHGIDLVTVVTHGRKGLSRALGSSTAEEIIAESSCPVLAVRPPQREFVEHRDGQTQLRLKRILLATNFRPSSVAASQLATQLANAMAAQLHAVYVIGDYFEQISMMFPEGGLAALTRLQGYVEERMSHFERSEPNATTHITEGRPYQEIIKLATSHEIDLIVLGTAVHRSLFGNSQVLGSEIERVIRNAPCPVLCVPAARVLTPLPALVTQAIPQT